MTFDSQFTSSSPLIHGSYVTDPAYNAYAGPGGSSDPHDLAVVLLDAAPSITPAQLPTAGLLNTTALRSQTFTAVGYGTVRSSSTTGPNAFFFDSTRRYAEQFFLSLEPAWLNLSENPSTGSGGTCYGDSGGPALPRWGDQQPRGRDHRHRRRGLPRDRQDLPARHTVGPRLPRPVRHAAVALQRRPRAKAGPFAASPVGAYVAGGEGGRQAALARDRISHR